MKYINAKTVLPERLLKELQQYIQGELIYVPGDSAMKARWGELNGTKKQYDARNNEIVRLYKNGRSIREIAAIYFLSEYSIKKIVGRCKYDSYKQEEAAI